MYATIDVDTKLLLDIALFARLVTDPAAAFLHGVAEKHDVLEAVFLVDGFGYSTALLRLGLSGRLDYTTRNLIEKWFHAFKMGTDRFHTSWIGSRTAVRRWPHQFRLYYNRHRPHQSLYGHPPAEVI